MPGFKGNAQVMTANGKCRPGRSLGLITVFQLGPGGKWQFHLLTWGQERGAVFGEKGTQLSGQRTGSVSEMAK